MTRFKSHGAAIALIAGLASAPLHAGEASLQPAQLIEDIGASERVEAAALLRVLSQEAASAACHFSYGVAEDEARKLMTEAKAKFDLLLDALQYGNPAMNIIGGEERRNTVEKIEALRAQWAPLRDAGVVLLDNPKDKDALTLIKAENEAVLAATSELTSDIAGEYSNPAELMQVDVLLLDFSARQAMLTQKMAKIGCEIWAGNRSDDRIELLTSIMQTYDLTLNALLNGMPAVGVIPAPTPEIKAALTEATADWQVIKAELDEVMHDGDLPEEKRVQVYHDLNKAMYDMEHIEKLYVGYSKHKYDEPELSDAVLID